MTPISASALLSKDPESHPGVLFNDPGLDSLFLGGRGFPTTGIVELCGEAGCGKTQLVMQLCLRYCEVTGGCALIVNTEGPFPAARLQQMAVGMKGGVGLLERVKIQDVSDAKALDLYCTNSLPGLVAREGIRLVVVDSMAAVFRGGELSGVGDAPERSRAIFALAGHLLKVNADTGCALVVTNQVMDVVGERGGLAGALTLAASLGMRCVPRQHCALSAGRWVRPALGLSWDAAASHRILMVKGGWGGASRTLFLLSSSVSPPAQMAYDIGEGGITSREASSPLDFAA